MSISSIYIRYILIIIILRVEPRVTVAAFVSIIRTHARKHTKHEAHVVAHAIDILPCAFKIKNNIFGVSHLNPYLSQCGLMAYSSGAMPKNPTLIKHKLSKIISVNSPILRLLSQT